VWEGKGEKKKKGVETPRKRVQVENHKSAERRRRKVSVFLGTKWGCPYNQRTGGVEGPFGKKMRPCGIEQQNGVSPENTEAKAGGKVGWGGDQKRQGEGGDGLLATKSHFGTCNLIEKEKNTAQKAKKRGKRWKDNVWDVRNLVPNAKRKTTRTRAGSKTPERAEVLVRGHRLRTGGDARQKLQTRQYERGIYWTSYGKKKKQGKNFDAPKGNGVEGEGGRDGGKKTQRGGKVSVLGLCPFTNAEAGGICKKKSGEQQLVKRVVYLQSRGGGARESRITDKKSRSRQQVGKI